MKCNVCCGACCEFFTLSPLEVRVSTRDHRRWFELHARVTDDRLIFDCRCRSLQWNGQCAIYEDRPQMCRDFIAGGKECLEAVRTRRHSFEYNEIRDATDPERL
jgi:Fe-S-cluster containining protein